MAINVILQAPALGVRDGLADFNLTYDQLFGYSKAWPGMTFPFQGNLYQVVQNRSGGAIVTGEAVSLALSVAARTGNLTGASTKAVVVTDDTLDANLQGTDSFPGRIFTTAGVLATTADMEDRRILANSTAAGASTVTVAKFDRINNLASTATVNAFTATQDASSDYSIFCPWEVVKADADAVATAAVQGICVSTSITDDYFGIIQISGVAMAEVDGTTDLAVGDPVSVGSTAGVLVKTVFTTTAATEAQLLAGLNKVGRVLDAYTDGSAGRRAILLENSPLIAYPITQ
jgi:hypothetical protein